MPSLKHFARKTGLPRQRRWSGVYSQVKELAEAMPPPPPDPVEAPQSDLPPVTEIFSYPELVLEMPFYKCLRKVEQWWMRLPESYLYAADVVLEKRLRPDYSPPGDPKPPLQGSEIDYDLQKRVVAEGFSIAGTAEQRGPEMTAILNASHFSNDPGNWSISGVNEMVYRGVPRGLLLEVIAAYPRAGQANSPTEAVQDVISWFLAHGITAVGQVHARGRYAIAVVRNDDGQLDVACYDPHNYQRVLDPNFFATPDQVHSGQYNNYREGPYDTKYGTVFI